MKMSKYFYAGTLLIVFIAILIVGCVKIPSEAPPLPEFKASVRFMNTMLGGDPVAVSVDGDAMATLEAGEASEYMVVNAGNRIIAVDDTVLVDTTLIETDFKGTVYIVEDGFVLNKERWTHTNTAYGDTVNFCTIAQMATDTVSVSVLCADSVLVWDVEYDTISTDSVVADTVGSHYEETDDREVVSEDLVPGGFDKSVWLDGLSTITITSTVDTLLVEETFEETMPGGEKNTFVILGEPGNLSLLKLENQ